MSPSLRDFLWILCLADAFGDLLLNVRKNASQDLELLALLAEPWGPEGRRAMEALYLRHSFALRRFLRRLAGDDARIEDWMQDTFLIARRHAAQFSAGSARAWLLTLGAQRMRDARRSDRRRQRREQEFVRERDVELQEPLVTPLETALASLPRSAAMVLELRFVQGLTQAEVARILGVSLRTAKARSAEALDQLRVQMDRELGS